MDDDGRSAIQKIRRLYTTSEFITVFTATVTGAYPSQINPIRLVTTHFLKVDLDVAPPTRDLWRSETQIL